MRVQGLGDATNGATHVDPKGLEVYVKVFPRLRGMIIERELLGVRGRVFLGS